ncbi:protease [Bdellovibrio sp. NC01]|uniref:protease n=1 Tax=Bdellovibrio sp. NC01 TaxID=2220073 RepID=UPI00115B9D3C|nr:protease [Bdellovibrio sp. NC01]QDK37255.1 protease [Bdellovibrio sp. NC01]
MKKNIFAALGALMAFACLSTAVAGEFDGGSGEFDPRPNPTYNEAEIQKKIAQEMEIACSGNLCKIVGTDGQGQGWTVSFNVGYGNNNNNNGTAIYIGDNPNNANNMNWNAGITVTYKNYTCQSSLRVTPAVYRFVNTYMYNMVNSDGSTKRNFSPADQTVILFYTTMLNKVESCGNNTGAK